MRALLLIVSYSWQTRTPWEIGELLNGFSNPYVSYFFLFNVLLERVMPYLLFFSFSSLMTKYRYIVMVSFLQMELKKHSLALPGGGQKMELIVLAL